MEKTLLIRSQVFKTIIKHMPLDMDLIYVITLDGCFSIVANGDYVIVKGGSIGNNRIPSLAHTLFTGLAEINKFINEKSGFEKNVLLWSLQGKYIMTVTKTEKKILLGMVTSKRITIESAVKKTDTALSGLSKINVKKTEARKEVRNE